MTTRSGYNIRIVGFVPVDPANLAAHEQILADLKEARFAAEGSKEVTADKMFRRMEIETFEVKPVTRRAKEGGA